MLTEFAGNWNGTNRLYFEGADGPMLESPSALSAAMVIPGFLELKYDWSYEGKTKEGVLLVSRNTKQNLATKAWADTFHTSGRVMMFEGTPTERGIDVKGSYSVGEGPAWGWRTGLELAGAELRITMYNISPEGVEYLAVAAVYQRA